MKRTTVSLLLLVTLTSALLTAARAGDVPTLPRPPSALAAGPATAAPPTTTAPARPCLIAEFESQAALVLAAAETDEATLDVILRVAVAAAARSVVLVLASNDDEEQILLDHLAKPAPCRSRRHPIHVVQVPHDTHWTRDYGPITLLDSERNPVMLDFEYAGVGTTTADDRAQDELVPFFLADLLDTPCVRVPLLVDGGNLLTNGAGVGATTSALLEENREFGRKDAATVRQLQGVLGLRELVILEPLEEEPTRHVDMFVTFTGRRDVVVARVDPRRDPINAARLDENARVLANVRTAHGPLRVIRIPMPRMSDGLWRSYTNVIYLNGAVLVPSYRDVAPAVEREVHAAYRRLLPGWEVVPVDCTALITGGGALRCISMAIPWFPDGPFSERMRPRR